MVADGLVKVTSDLSKALETEVAHVQTLGLDVEFSIIWKFKNATSKISYGIKDSTKVIQVNM